VPWKSPAGQLAPSGIPYTVTGYIDQQNLVARVETWTEDAFMGDLHVAALFSNYGDVSGVLVPRTIEQQRAEGEVFGVEVTDAAAMGCACAATCTGASSARPICARARPAVSISEASLPSRRADERSALAYPGIRQVGFG
jgi:hypothetical protein